MKTLKPGPRTEILADIAKAAKELKEDDFSELIKSIQTSKKNLEALSEKIDWEQKVLKPILSVFDTDKVPENLANFESFLNHQKMNSRIKDLMSFIFYGDVDLERIPEYPEFVYQNLKDLFLGEKQEDLLNPPLTLPVEIEDSFKLWTQYYSKNDLDTDAIIARNNFFNSILMKKKLCELIKYLDYIMFIDFDKIIVFDLLYSFKNKTITLKNHMRNENVLEKNYLCLETINFTIFNKECDLDEFLKLFYLDEDDLFPHLLKLIQDKISNWIVNLTKKMEDDDLPRDLSMFYSDRIRTEFYSTDKLIKMIKYDQLFQHLYIRNPSETEKERIASLIVSVLENN